MLEPRVIPCLLLRRGGLVKTLRFADAKYVGDPINAVKIFNDKEVDELVLLDITATAESRSPDFALLQDIANEAFMPMAYGGGLRCLEDLRRVLKIGFEKVVLNTIVAEDCGFVRKASKVAGAQSIVVSIDVRRKSPGRYEVFARAGTSGTGRDPVSYARDVEAAGAGEIILNSIDRDGTQEGYDLELLKRVTSAVGIPVVALGGAGSLYHLAEAFHKGGAAAASAGSLFVFHGRHRAVLISYPERTALRDALARVMVR